VTSTVSRPGAYTPLRTPTRVRHQVTPRRRAQPGERLLFWFTFLVAAAATLARNPWVFTDNVHESWDHALNSILVQDSHHQLLLTGPVSRLGFAHPGPVYVYLLSLGQGVFHDWAPVAASAYGGQFIGDTLVVSLLLALVVRVLHRWLGSLPAAACAAGLIFAFGAEHDMLGDTWLPSLYCSAFALLVISTVAVSAGRTAEVPYLILASGLLVHGHVAFIMFVAVCWLFAPVGWLFSHHPRQRRAELRAARWRLWSSAGLVLAFLAPMVAELVLHFPGPWPAYLTYGQHRSGHSMRQSLAFFGHFWSSSYPAPAAILLVAAAIALLLLDLDRRRGLLFIRAYLLLGLLSALFVYYVAHGIDELSPATYYTGWFYRVVPMFLLVLPLSHLLMLLAQLPLPFRGAKVAAAVAVILLALTGATSATLVPSHGPDDPTVAPVLAAIERTEVRLHRAAVLRFTHDQWETAAGVIAAADRAGLPVCLADPYWRGLFSAASMCSTTDGQVELALVGRSDYRGRHPVVWSDRGHILFEGVVPNLVAPKG